MATLDEVRAAVSYNPDTGEFIRVGSKQRPDLVGIVTSPNTGHGYKRIWIGRRKYYAHRLAYLLMTGEWPAEEIDHINGNRADNRWENLRHASRLMNAQNMRKPRSDNKSGALGVSWDSRKRKWIARIKVGEKYKIIGWYRAVEDASHAYVSAKRKYHEGCTI